jgi:hypothetical protein
MWFAPFGFWGAGVVNIGDEKLGYALRQRIVVLCGMSVRICEEPI